MAGTSQVSAPAWVTEWQYGQVRALVASRAELLVWLDLIRWQVMQQVVRRALRRRLHRQVPWNGNIKPPLRTIFTDPEHIVRWAWSTHSKAAERVDALRAQRPDLDVVRLASREAVEAWERTSARGREPILSPYTDRRAVSPMSSRPGPYAHATD